MTVITLASTLMVLGIVGLIVNFLTERSICGLIGLGLMGAGSLMGAIGAFVLMLS